MTNVGHQYVNISWRKTLLSKWKMRPNVSQRKPSLRNHYQLVQVQGWSVSLHLVWSTPRSKPTKTHRVSKSPVMSSHTTRQNSDFGCARSLVSERLHFPPPVFSGVEFVAAAPWMALLLAHWLHTVLVQGAHGRLQSFEFLFSLGLAQVASPAWKSPGFPWFRFPILQPFKSNPMSLMCRSS